MVIFVINIVSLKRLIEKARNKVGKMQLTNRTEYALRFLIYLAKDPETTVKMSDVSNDEDIPRQFLAQIVNDLKKSGLVNAFRGPTGGIKLARSAAEITALDVLTSIEGPLALFKCLETNDYCDKSSSCPLCGFWAQTQTQIKQIFTSTTVADLLNKAPDNNTRRKNLEEVTG